MSRIALLVLAFLPTPISQIAYHTNIIDGILFNICLRLYSNNSNLELC
jgi:hypothetical protein